MFSAPIPYNDLPKYDVNETEAFNRPVINLARLLHLKGYPFERIFLATHLPPAKYAKFHPIWERMREKIDEVILKEIRTEAIGKKAEDFVHKGMHIANKFLDNIIKRQTELDPKEFKLISDAIANIHRIGQLEKGAPTDIAMYQNMSPKQLKEYLIATAKSVKAKYGEVYEIPTDADIPYEENMLAIAKEGPDGGAE